MPRRRPEFESGVAGAEADKLKKFIDAGGLKFSGCLTPAEPILESRAVYMMAVLFFIYAVSLLLIYWGKRNFAFGLIVLNIGLSLVLLVYHTTDLFAV